MSCLAKNPPFSSKLDFYDVLREFYAAATNARRVQAATQQPGLLSSSGAAGAAATSSSSSSSASSSPDDPLEPLAQVLAHAEGLRLCVDSGRRRGKKLFRAHLEFSSAAERAQTCRRVE